ncbi:hypothetical protein F2Q70_00020022 [Brassica cretica]|uniref:Uncharacterized protein n=1 Tax=Brassica cretica TaxID=69181 RepID=A0A8S9GQC0_BRACR|nr:hypothetical protein F2Q70_00020022 [Brassica cretica]
MSAFLFWKSCSLHSSSIHKAWEGFTKASDAEQQIWAAVDPYAKNECCFRMNVVWLNATWRDNMKL